jgi:hypothetical protein
MRVKRDFFKINKKGQITIFVILAIIIVAGIVLYFFISKPVNQEIPVEFQPVYNYYLTCLEETAKQGISLLGEQAGYIEKPIFIPGSQYMPFSSQMNFLGQGVPYWLYVSGNNILREQVPKLSSMEKQLADYIKERVNYCDFSDFNLKGFDVLINENPDIEVNIDDLEVNVKVKNSMGIYFEDSSVSLKQQDFSLKSKLGKFYKLALDVYNYEKRNVFLEKYALDVLRLYAPVDGTEITCKPKVFNEQAIKQNISEALAENIAALKLSGSYYNLGEKNKNYFITNIGRSVDENVNFIYSADMPTKIEIYGDKVVQPVGLQEGLGILGFCYVPYHLIYDIGFPVLIQFFDEKEMFQFPIAVIIERNKERQGFEGESALEISSDVCKYNSQPFSIYTYDSELNPLEANLRFKCINTECNLGESRIINGEAVFEGNLPQCFNGFILANAKGYADTKYIVSSNEETTANVVLNKIHNLNLDLGKEVDYSIVTFSSDKYSTTLLYPETRNIELVEGLYNVSVFVYKNSSITLPASNERKCIKIPKSNILGLFGGGEDEKCFDMNIPSQNIEYALVGGGTTQEYITENQLRTGNKLNMAVQLFGTPKNTEELQQNYFELDSSKVYIEII